MKFINSFEDLIIESQISLLLEGNLTASAEFLLKLSKIKDNKIAEFLFDKFSDGEFVDKNLPQNIVDVTDKEDTITFMSDKSFIKSGMDVADANIFKLKGRSETRVGRFAKALCNELGKKFSDKEIEEFVNMYKSSQETPEDKFKLVSGEKIAEYYHEDKYASGAGTLTDSCMKYPDCSEYFQIYTDNPEICRMLVYLNDDDEVMGRALIWKIHGLEMDKEGCDATYFMDRIYTIKDSDVIKFKNYADSNGWVYRKLMSNDPSIGGTLQFIYNKKTFLGKIIVKLSTDSSQCDPYPYVDTLKFCDGKKLISNVGFLTKGTQFIMDDTEGGSDFCNDCDNHGLIDIGKECRECNGDGSIKCPDCKCKDCSEGWIKCSKCDGDETVTCEECGGQGWTDCTKCTRGIIGECKKCKCLSFTCKICNGEGTYNKKWGLGKRRVKCNECDGSGEITPEYTKNGNGYVYSWVGSSYVGATSPNRCDCSTSEKIGSNLVYRNKGIILCNECEEGSKPCNECDSNGYTTCPKCDGSGGKECKKCDNGVIKNKCKNKKCESGHLDCPNCKGTGELDKDQKIKCPQCAGLLEEFKRKI